MNNTKLTTIISLLLLLPVFALAQPEPRTRLYTKEHPLIYEDVRDLWPYSFLNEKGEPEGFNVDLVRMLLNELQIPYTIKLTNNVEAFNDLKEGNSDLIMGLSAGYHDEYGRYSNNSVTLFTQSVVSPKSKPTTVKNFHDLATHRIIVNNNSLAHHLMTDYGWGNNAIPTRDVATTLQKMSTDDEGELVWNTLSLKWLINKYQIENLELTPMNMPHGEYKFLSNDPGLLNKLDSMLVELSSADRLTPLNNKWFYPERKEKKETVWYWYWASGIGIFIVILLLYTLSYRLQASRITKENNKRNRRLSLILETAGVRVWTYDVDTDQFTWRNEFGQPAYVYSREEFAHRYTPKDFERLNAAIKELAENTLDKGTPDKDITLRIKAKDAREDGDTEMHDFDITLSVLQRNKAGRPIELIGTKKDITKKVEQERIANERTLRYWALAETPIVGVILFDEHARLLNLNKKACEMFGCNREELVAEKPTLNQFFSIDISLDEADGFEATQIVHYERVSAGNRSVKSVKRKEKLYNDYRLMSFKDEAGQLKGVFAICHDVTYRVESIEKEAELMKELEVERNKEQEYVYAINDFISNAKVRIVSYSPTMHVFTVNKSSSEVQHRLTPTRLMTLVDSRMRIKTMHLLNKMDSGEQKAIDTEIETTLRLKGGIMLYVHIHMLPQLDKNGKVYEYLGILRDISELKSVEQQLAIVEAQTQEVEDTKTAFIRNMMQEIRKPMNRVIENAAQLNSYGSPIEQKALRSNITYSAQQLTHVIDNILYLSRLEAHMVKIVKRPTDFADIFGAECAKGWSKGLSEMVKCVVENPYEQLVIDIDAEHLGNVIQQLTLNAVQYTKRGIIHTRYDYIGRRLMISIDDTGEGIPPEVLKQLNNEDSNTMQTHTGMGLVICKELLRQMGGHLEINSEVGLGTTVWVTLPCTATIVKRKKNL